MSNEETTNENLVTEAESIRREIRERLDSAYESAAKMEDERRGEAHSNEMASLVSAERDRVVEEEEDRFYAEHGLHRYVNHRGTTEWITKKALEERAVKRKRNRSRSDSRRKGTKRRTELAINNLINVGLTLAVLGLAAYAMWRVYQDRSDEALQIHVSSEPPGAAVFIDGKVWKTPTPTFLAVDKPGVHRISVFRPGYVPTPSDTIIDLQPGYTPKINFLLIPHLRNK